MHWGGLDQVRKNVFTGRAIGPLEGDAQGGCGVTIPGGVYSKCCIQSYCSGLVDMVVLGQKMDLMVSEVCSNVIECVILFPASAAGWVTANMLVFICVPSSLLPEGVKPGLTLEY